jgi:hypothetical protein
MHDVTVGNGSGDCLKAGCSCPVSRGDRRCVNRKTPQKASTSSSLSKGMREPRSRVTSKLMPISQGMNSSEWIEKFQLLCVVHTDFAKSIPIGLLSASEFQPKRLGRNILIDGRSETTMLLLP